MRHHYHFTHFNLKRELNELYATIALHVLAVGLIGLFIPIYLFGLGYALPQIFFFYILAFGTYFIFTPFSMKIISKIGLKHSMLLSMVIWLGAFSGLYLLESLPVLLYIIPVTIGVYWTFFWLAYHTDFAQNTDQSRRGKAVGMVNVIIAFLSMVTPAVGAIIVTYLGFHILLLSAAVFIIASPLPLFLTKDIFPPFNYRMEFDFLRQHPKTIIGFIGYGGEKSGAGAVLWPLFIFATFSTYLAVGSIISLALVFGLLGAFVVGIVSDKIEKRKLVKTGAILHSFSWLAKTLAVTAISFFTVDAVSRVTHELVSIPKEALEFDRANQSNAASVVVAREMSIALGAVIFFAIVLVANNLVFGLVLGAGFTLLYYFT